MPAGIIGKQPTVEDVLNELSKIKSVVADAVDDGVRTAVKAMKQGRHAAEDVLDEAKHKVKQRPLEAMGIVFAAGVLAGSLIVGLIGSRRR